MTACNRCKRTHSGICIIPAGVVLGFGAHVGGSIKRSSVQTPAKGKSVSKKPGTSVLKAMLVQAHAQVEELNDRLKLLPSELAEECDELMNRLRNWEDLVRQLNLQIIALESR